ncbi:unannotated protein [freshwater metagenome]|uniref:Unannotated protein n=1 Tax=freshwater metagenome TaxID=449393 RepID=A0A6J6Z7F1_9ZZZZ
MRDKTPAAPLELSVTSKVPLELDKLEAQVTAWPFKSTAYD